MSFSYTFSKSEIQTDQWLEKLEDVVISADVDDPPAGVWREMLLSSVIRQSSTDEGEDGLYIHFLTEGSIRGVTVMESECEIEIRLNIFASFSDQLLAARMVWEAIQCGATVGKEGEGPITVDDLDSEKVAALHAEWFGLSMGSLDVLSEMGRLPIYEFLDLKLYPTDKEKDAQALEQDLVDQLAKFVDAFPSTLMTVNLGETGEKTMAILQLEMKSLITKDVDVVALPEGAGVVSIEDFVAAIGELALDGGGCWVFPPVSELHASTLADLGNKSLTPLEKKLTGELDDEELALIGLAPVAAFLLVAAADGNIDKKEVNGFEGILAKLADQNEHPLVSQMMQAAQHCCTPETLEMLITGSHKLTEVLQEFTTLVDQKFDSQEAKMMKVAVLHVAKHVAEASGGFLGFGSKISKSEKKALTVIIYMLGLADGLGN